MLRLTTLLFLAGFIFSCKHPTGIKEMTAHADSAAINFFKGDGSMDSVFRVRIIRDKKQLDDLSSYIESSTTENFKCGYDGSIHFFTNNVVIKEVDFRMNDDACMHFSFMIDGKIYNTRLTTGAKGLLQTIMGN